MVMKGLYYLKLVYRLLKRLLLALKMFLLKMRLSVAGVEEAGGYSKALIIAPHPDDEVLGLAGFMIRQLRAGKSLSVVYLSNGEKSQEELDGDEIAARRKQITLSVHDRLGFDTARARWCGFPDGGIPGKNSKKFKEALETVRSILVETAPDAVFVTHPLDMWPDHIAAYELVTEAVRGNGLKCDVYAYWVWVWYSMPLTAILRLLFRPLYRLPVGKDRPEKHVLTDLYLQPKAPNGKAWSGTLPEAMVRALDYPYEIVERIV